MITREDIINNGGKNINMKTERKWTRKSFYIFVKDDYKFLGRKPEANDFIEKVNIKVIGCITRPGCPLWIKCKNKNINYRLMRDQTEIFNNSEEIENSLEMKNYLKNFLENYKIKVIEENHKLQKEQGNICKKIKENVNKLDLLEELLG